MTLKRWALTALGVMGVLASPPVMAQTAHRVTIINETHHVMVRFYSTNSGRPLWGDDILGDRILKPGQAVPIDVDDGSGACVYDFRAEFDDGSKLVRTGIDVCKLSSYRYTAG